MEQPPNSRRFSVWSAMFLSFFSADLYRDVGRNWRGIGLRLVVLVLAITWIAFGIKVHNGLNKFARDEFPKVIEEFPPITITDGLVSSPVTQPYTIRDKETGKAMAVLDTTGEITSLDQTEAVILLTENKLHYRDNNNGQTRIQDLSQVKNFYVDRAKVTYWFGIAAKWFAWVFVPLGFIFSLIYRLIQALIYGAIGLIWNSAFNARLTYAALMRLAFVSVTPVILVGTALMLAGIHIPAANFICLVIEMIYLAIAVKANSMPPEPMFGGGMYQQQYPYPQQQYPYPQQQYPYPSQQPFPPMPPPPQAYDPRFTPPTSNG